MLLNSNACARSIRNQNYCWIAMWDDKCTPVMTLKSWTNWTFILFSKLSFYCNPCERQRGGISKPKYFSVRAVYISQDTNLIITFCHKGRHPREHGVYFSSSSTNQKFPRQTSRCLVTITLMFIWTRCLYWVSVGFWFLRRKCRTDLVCSRQVVIYFFSIHFRSKQLHINGIAESWKKNILCLNWSSGT